ncbi:ATP synthase F0 subunit B [Thermodesulfobacteriota bacterium]
MIVIDKSLVVQIVNFIFLIVVLNIVLFKPIRKILRQRKEKVGSLEQNIETYNKDADEKDVSYLMGIKEARSKGFTQKEEIMQTASEEERAIISKINAKAREDLDAVREKIVTDAAKVSASLLSEIDTFAEAIGQKIMGRTI